MAAETGTVRYPKAFLNGIVLQQVEVNLVRLQNPSTFEAVMALDDPSNPGAAYWSSLGEDSATISIDAGDGSGSKIVFQGQFTHTEVNFGPREVRAEGKCDVDKMIGTRTDEAFVNTPVSGVVSQLAGKAGVGTNIQGGGQMAGHTYDYSEYRYNTDYQNVWDAIQEMAYQVGNHAFVDAATKTLNFVQPTWVNGNYSVVYVPPSESTVGGNTGPNSYDQSNVAIQLLCGHDCTLQGGSSWTADGSFSYDDKTYTGKSGGGDKQFYGQHPGRTQEQQQTRSSGDKALTDQHSLTIEVTAPGDPSVTASTGVTLSGTGSAWDTQYVMQSVTHRVSFDQGYTMEIVANAGGDS